MNPDIKIPPINDELRNILGRVCFQVAHIGRQLHDMQLYVVDTKAEDEQACALHFFLVMYQHYGDNWVDEANLVLEGKKLMPPQTAGVSS